jgi:hypothetical protein
MLHVHWQRIFLRIRHYIYWVVGGGGFPNKVKERDMGSGPRAWLRRGTCDVGHATWDIGRGIRDARMDGTWEAGHGTLDVGRAHGCDMGRGTRDWLGRGTRDVGRAHGWDVGHGTRAWLGRGTWDARMAGTWDAGRAHGWDVGHGTRDARMDGTRDLRHAMDGELDDNRYFDERRGGLLIKNCYFFCGST